MINEDRKKLYDALSSEYDLGTYEEFERNIGDSVKRRKLYDAASADYDLGDFESYSQRIGPTHKESLDAFTAEHGSWLDDFEARDSAETNMSKAGMSSGIYVPTEGSITGQERKRYMELHKQEEALKKAWFTSDEYLAQKDADAQFLSDTRKGLSKQMMEYAQANPVLRQEGPFQINPYATRGAEADTELEKYRTASRILDDAINMHNAPSKYDGANVWQNIGKFGKGAADTLSDVDFWSMGLTEIADNLGVRDVLSTVQEKLGNLNDLSEESIENILSPAEKAVLQAWAINTQEQLKRKDDLSRGYQAGKGAAESLGFMAEFALTGGIGKAATEGVEQMAKWLGKKALTKVGGMTDDVAAKVLKETGEKIAQSTVGKYGVGLAESLAEAAGRTGVMPSTFRNISEKATEIETDENGNNYLVKMNDAFAKGYVDSFIENLSEGGRVNALGTLFGDVAGKIPAYKKMVDKFSHTKASELWDAFNSSGVMNTLRAGGWHGLGEEYLEEWYGNALRTLTGVDKEALKDFATVDNQIVTLTSFLPMTIFGGTVSTAQVLSANKDLEKKAAALKSALMERGYDEAQANNMIDMMRGAAPAEVSETLTPIVNSVALRNTNEAAALMKPVGEFAAAVQRWQSFNTKYNYQEQEQRDGLRAQMEETLGQFWQQDENGRQTVQRGVNEKGEVVYMLGKPSVEDVEAGVTSEVAAVTSDGRKVFVNPSEYQLEDELEMNTFLGNEIMAEKGNREQARMIEEKEAKIAAIRETAVPGTAVNIGTAEAPMQAIVLQRNPDGVIVNTPDGQTRQMTYEEFGNYVGINAVPMTDAQIDEHEADVLTADRAQREAALDQEYENEDAALEELSEAEDEIEQAVDTNTPLPMKADGSVDQTALWNSDPERWAQWNDEQRQDGGANSLAYVSGAIAKEQAKIAELQAAYAAESDFDARDAIEKEIADTQARVGRLTAIQQGYVAQAEAAAAPVAETQPGSTLTARMASEMTQQELNDLDESYDIILSQTRVPEEKARLLQEYLDRVAEGSTPIKVLTRDNYEDVMRAAGCPEADIIAVGRVMKRLKPGRAIAGFVSAESIFVMADGIPSISEARVTYVHERQHVINSLKADKVREMAIALGDKANALAVLEKFVGVDGLAEYENDTFLKLADEIIARCMEIAYTTEEFSVDLQSKGLSDSVISIIEEIDNEQRNDKSLIAARRSAHAGISRRTNAAQDGRNSGQVSGGILVGEENRSAGVGGQGTGAGSTGEGAEAEVISEEQLNAPNSGTAQQITAADGEVLADTNGKGGVRFSIRTWNEGGRDYLASWLANDTTLTDEEKADILARMDEFYKNALLYSDTYVPFGTWSDAGVRYDNNGNPLMSVIKANGDYAMNLDFSLVCKKRRPLNRLLRTLVNRNAFATYTLRERELAEINWILQEHGFEVACALCFVDSKRYRVTGVADVFAALYNRLVKSLAPEGVQIAHFNYNENPNVEVVENGLDTMSDDQLNWDRFDRMLSAYKPGSVEHKVAQYLREHPEARKLVDATDFIEAEGFESVKENNPDLLKFYNMKKGTGGPKASFGDVQYLNDILKKEKSFDAEKAYAVGGVRLQSFSDFVPHMYFDYMQLFAELAAKKLPLHAYTKEVLFAKIFGLTGAKINMSLVPAVVEGGIAPGLDAEGNYAWADPVTDAEDNVIQQGQSFPYDEAMAIQQAEGYSKNCGVIAVGISDAHIEKMLDDPNIPFIIPYHKSSLNAIVARMTNIDQYKDYTNVQNTRKASGSKLDKGTKDFNFNEYLHGLGESGTPQQAAQAYLDWCRENNYKPKFSQFAYHPNYYKLLQDFNTIDLATGEYAPQGAVTMTFPTEESTFGNVETLIQQGLQEDAELEEKMEQEIDGIADQVLARLEEISKEPKMSEKQQAKKMAELADERTAKIKAKAKGPIDLIEEAKKAQKKHEAKTKKSSKAKKEDVRLRVASEESLVPGHKKGQPMLSDAEMMADVSFRITAEQDKAYMDAVEAGDMEAAQAMVYSAAQATGYNSPRLYHGTDAEFTTFDKEFNDPGSEGFFFTNSEEMAASYGKNIKQVYLHVEDPYVIEGNGRNWNQLHTDIFSVIPEIEDQIRVHEIAMKSFLDRGKISQEQYDHFREKYYNKVNFIKDESKDSIFDIIKKYIYRWQIRNFKSMLNVERTRDFEWFLQQLDSDVNIIFKDITDFGPNAADFYIARDVAHDVYVTTNPKNIKSADAVTYDDEGKVIPLSERFNPESSDIRFRTMRTDEQREQLFDNAKERFGLTNNFKVAGYMLPDGSLLDFSEANDGGDPNQRTQDHREVADLIMDEGRDYEYRYEYVLDFVGEGAIRMLPEYAGFQLSVPPTAEQRSKLMDYIYKYNGEVIMEITDENGGPRVYMEYNKRTSPSRIFRDMDGFFNEGIVPGIPPLRFRIANDNQAIFVSNAAKAIDGIKMEKATPEQWLKMIEKNGGLKAGEDKWIGLSDFLKSSDKKTLTKQEVLDFINENMIIIEEQHYGNREKAFDDKYPNWRKAFSIQKSSSDEGIYTSVWNIPTAVSLYNQYHEDKIDVDEYGGITREEYEKIKQFADEIAVEYFGTEEVRQIHNTRLTYTTDGLENKYEIALTIPTIEPWNKGDDIHFGDAGDGRAVAWIRFGETEVYDVVDRSQEIEKAKAEYLDYTDNLKEKYNIVGYGMGTLDEKASSEEKETYDAMFRKIKDLQKEHGSKISVNKKVLVIDEIQSKRHQEGREKGYKKEEGSDIEIIDDGVVIEARYNGRSYFFSRGTSRTTIESSIGYDTSLANRDGIPDAPFDKNWHELAMKRMLRYAAENGYDVIAWTKGEQQAERYDIGGVVESIYYAGSFKDGIKDIDINLDTRRGGNIHLQVDNDGKVINEYNDSGDIENSPYIGKNLSEILGKELANKVLSLEEKQEISSEGLHVGGEGMKGFYDKMLPAFMNKYGKKWGVKVEDIDLPNLGKSGRTMHSVPVTEEMKASVMEGQVMFRTTAITQEVQDEMDAISATAIVRGNYLKAPNGADTNLTPEQWAMVRTKSFIRWFGDWMKPQRIEKLRRSKPVVVNGDEYVGNYELNKKSAQKYIIDHLRGQYTNADTGDKIHVSNIGAQKVTSHGYNEPIHLASVMYIPRMIEEAIFITEEPNTKRKNEFETYRYYVCGLKIGGEDYTAKLVVGVSGKETYYDHDLSSIEKGKLIESRGLVPTRRTNEESTLSEVKDKRLISILKEDFSKVVDENGEPKVVYHGSPNEFSTFDEDMIGENTDSGFYGRGFYFATTEEESRGYGEYVIPAFLSMQNPLDLNELYAISDKWDGATADGAVKWWYGLASLFPNDAISETVYASIGGEDWTIMDLKNRIDELAETSETPFADAAEEFGIDEDFFDMMGEEDVNLPDELTDALKANGYDGVINAGVENNELVALYPNQIKSATDNTGEFSAEDKDVRYRVMSDVNTNPTEAQKKAGNYKMGHLNLDGYRITIENPKGSVRRGTDSKGNAWENTLNNDYGYIRGTEGVDGDHIDVYLSDNPTEGNVFVIDQVNPETREFDEHKVMYGFNSAEEAREAYLANFSEGWNGLGTITEVSKDEFKKWIESSLRKTKPFSEYKSVKTIEVQSEGEDMEDNLLPSTGIPTDEVVTNGLQLTPAQTAEVAANIFAALPEASRKKITEGLNGDILGLKDAILQIPTSLATKENWNEEDKQMADVVAEEMTKMAGEMTRPFSVEEGLWLLYNNLNKGTDLVSQASRALVQRNLGFDAETLAKQEQAKEDVRFRTVGDATSNAQASLYNRGAVNVWTRLKESFVDMQASVEEFVKAIEKRTGKVAQGFENILLALNQQSSKGLAAMESYTQKFLNPMFDEIRRIMDETKMKYEDVVRYVILKHGLERNKKLAQRDARAHYQEIYDDIISKITGMTAAQKRTYLTNAQLKEGDAKAELATLKTVDMSAMTDEEKGEHKKKLAAARKAVEEAEEYLKRAQKIASLSEQEAQDELDMIFEKIENETDSVYKEMRENDYSGISSMFYDQLGVDRKNFSTEEQYQAALMEAKKDRYSSLKDIEAAAEAEVKSFEGKTDTKELWKRINAATKETLRQQYEANMISKDQYLNLRDMFEYYVPLRGFKDNTAEDMYTYYRKPNSTGYTKPILGAEGRKTEAESPFGWIAAMAGSAIASNVKNEAKLALYYFVSNRPENGIATISKTWFVDSGEVDERGKKIFKPAYPPFSEDLSSAEGKAQYEIWQANMKELQKKGQAYEAGQRLNLGNAVVNISDANKPEHIVNVKVGGKDYTIIINGNPRAAQAINGDLNIEGTAQDYSALFGPVLRWMSSVNTSYNPEFWITNMMRDMAFTMMAVNIKEDPAYRRKFKKNYLKAFKVISLVAKNEKGTIGDSYLEQQYKDFVKYGGVTGYTQIKDSETWEHEIENYLSSSDPESLKSGKVMRGMKSAFHAAHRFGESLEQVSRFAAFLTARETGKSINEAIDDAKEITVNFNRKGSGKMITLEEAKYLTGKNGQPLTKPQQWMVVGLSSIAPLGRRFIMFFNAAIQGLNATYKLMKKNPKRFTGWALGYAAVGMMNAVLHAMLDDDDDYLDIPQYERRNSLMIGGNGAYFKWALPQEARAFYALGDLAVETVMGRNPHQNVLGEALKIGTEILPVNPSEGWKAFMPSVAVPFIELALNEDYKGAPIYNEQKWLSEEEKERTAKWSSAYQGTGWTYVKIAQGLNFITGGDKHDAGWINLQPEKLEHLVQSAFGGTIRTADKFINTISAALDPEEPMTIRQTPFLNRFLTINDERFKNVHVNDVFDYYKADAEHALTLEKLYIKDRDMDSLTELRSSDEYQWAKIYGKYKKPLKAIQDKIKVADGTAEKKELMKQQDELKKRMIKEISEL